MSQRKKGGCNVTLVIQDEDWHKLATYKWNTADIKKQRYIVKTLDDAFGIKLKERNDLSWTGQ